MHAWTQKHTFTCMLRNRDSLTSFMMGIFDVITIFYTLFQVCGCVMSHIGAQDQQKHKGFRIPKDANGHLPCLKWKILCTSVYCIKRKHCKAYGKAIDEMMVYRAQGNSKALEFSAVCNKKWYLQVLMNSGWFKRSIWV